MARATNFVISYGRMKRSLDACLLEPEVFHMDPKKSDTKFFRTVCRSIFICQSFIDFPFSVLTIEFLVCF